MHLMLKIKTSDCLHVEEWADKQWLG